MGQQPGGSLSSSPERHSAAVEGSHAQAGVSCTGGVLMVTARRGWEGGLGPDRCCSLNSSIPFHVPS